MAGSVLPPPQPRKPFRILQPPVEDVLLRQIVVRHLDLDGAGGHVERHTHVVRIAGIHLAVEHDRLLRARRARSEERGAHEGGEPEVSLHPAMVAHPLQRSVSWSRVLQITSHRYMASPKLAFAWLW